MRGPTGDEILKTPPPELRVSSKTAQAYLDVRRKILTGEYPAHQLLLPKQIEEEHHINNTTTQMLLMRLANEGLVKVNPIKERTWPNNASLNEYRVADLTHTQKILALRQQAGLPDVTQESHAPDKEILLLKIQYADAEIARLLALAEGEKVVVSRKRERRADKTIVAISDLYAPFWFADVLPDLELASSDAYQLMERLGKKPARCTETVEVVQARSVERVLFELSPDDPAPLLKVQRHTFDAEDYPLALEFLTVRGDSYRLRYSFSIHPEQIPLPKQETETH
jgi:DNA-binding GntR family transcriptional regulator